MKDNCLLVSVESRKGGVGKTTAALNLARILLEKKGYAVLFLDVDITGTNATDALDSPFWRDICHTVDYKIAGKEPTDITFNWHGGVASFNPRKHASAWGEFWTSFAGPAVNLALAGAFFGLGLAFPEVGALSKLIDLAVMVNFYWFLINMIPVSMGGFALDGANMAEQFAEGLKEDPIAKRAVQFLSWPVASSSLRSSD